MAKKEQINVTLVRSPIGAQPKHRECVRGLGLKRMHQTVTLEDTLQCAVWLTKFITWYEWKRSDPPLRAWS